MIQDGSDYALLISVVHNYCSDPPRRRRFLVALTQVADLRLPLVFDRITNLCTWLSRSEIGLR